MPCSEGLWLHYDAATGHMCFSNALLCMKKNERVARASWGDRAHVSIDGDRMVMTHTSGLAMPFYASPQEMLALDWVQLV